MKFLADQPHQGYPAREPPPSWAGLRATPLRPTAPFLEPETGLRKQRSQVWKNKENGTQMPPQWLPKSSPNPKKSSKVPLQTPSRERSQKKQAKSAPPDPPGTLECSKTTIGSSKNQGSAESLFSCFRLPFVSLLGYFLITVGTKTPPRPPKRGFQKIIENNLRKIHRTCFQNDQNGTTSPLTFPYF